MEKKLYDYKTGKSRVEAILNGRMKVISKDALPKSDDLTFENSYESWITAVFVDIRNSTKLVSNDDQEMVAKIIRSFTSEIIEILRGEDEQREIGIRGDCVYAIYTTPEPKDISAVFDRVIWINCYLDMLNVMLKRKSYATISAGIGMATSRDHVIKAGRKGTGIADHVWLGRAVSQASKLSGLGGKEGLRTICVSNTAYLNFIDDLKSANSSKPVEDWFSSHSVDGLRFYNCSVVKTDMSNWINEGMPD